MNSEIILVKGKGSKDYILKEVEGYKTVILLTELEFSREYIGYNRNVQVGLSSKEMTENLFLSHERVIVEPYNKEDFISFLKNTDTLEGYLKSKNRKMYVMVQGDGLIIEGSKKLSKEVKNEGNLEIQSFRLKE